MMWLWDPAWENDPALDRGEALHYHLCHIGVPIFPPPVLVQSTRHEKFRGMNGLPSPSAGGGGPSSPHSWAQAGDGGPRPLLGVSGSAGHGGGSLQETDTPT